MYEITEQAPVAIPPAKQPINYAIPVRWILSHILLLSPGFIMFIWGATISPPNSPGACLALPLIIFGAFAAQAIGIVRVFREPYQYIIWIVAFGTGFAVMFVTNFSALIGGSKVIQTPWAIALVGGLMGLFEACALRRLYKRAWWWIPAHAAGLVLGTLATTQLSAPVRSLCAYNANTSSQCGYSPFVFPVVTGVALFSIITGATLIWITRREAAIPPPPPRPDFR